MGKPKIFLSRARVCTRFVAKLFFLFFFFSFLFSFLYKGVWGKPFFSLFFSFLSFPGKTSEEMGITSEMNNAGLCGSAWFYK